MLICVAMTHRQITSCFHETSEYAAHRLATVLKMLQSQWGHKPWCICIPPSKPVSLGSGQTQQQQNESDTAGRAMFPALHPAPHDMFTRTPVERARLFVWEYADRAWGSSLLPRRSPQRTWLDALSRTETPACICGCRSETLLMSCRRRWQLCCVS